MTRKSRSLLGRFWVVFSHFFLDLWNMIDLGIVVTGVVGLFYLICLDRASFESRSFLALASVLIWFKLLYFLRPFYVSGPLVTMILTIAYDIRVFLVTLFIVLAGFTQAFWILSNNDKSLEFGSLKYAFLNTFQYMLNSNIDVYMPGTSSQSLAQFLLVIFMLIMIILMLNLLIALMNDTFAKVRSRSEAIWRMEQAKTMIEQTFLYKNSYVERGEVPRQLFALKYTSDVSAQSNYVNTTEELTRLVNESVHSVQPFTPFEDSNEMQTETLKGDIKELTSHIHGIESNLADLKEVLKLLREANENK
jgi:hypothetical protein